MERRFNSMEYVEYIFFSYIRILYLWILDQVPPIYWMNDCTICLSQLRILVFSRLSNRYQKNDFATFDFEGVRHRLLEVFCASNSSFKSIECLVLFTMFKSQLISECLFDFFKFSKKPTKNLTNVCPRI